MYFFFVLVDRQKQEVVTRTANRWDRKKETQPTNFPQQQTNPYSPKVKTAMEAPPMRKSDNGLEKEKQNKHESAPFSSEIRGIKVCRQILICTSSQSTSSPLNQSTGSVVCRWGSRGGLCLSFTYIY